ncbi:MAG: hypothetical protein KBD78_04875 [Oligoflexales bacterium]|nr:hypothetical protein [Oligoflexales bacterium]
MPKTFNKMNGNESGNALLIAIMIAAAVGVVALQSSSRVVSSLSSHQSFKAKMASNNLKSLIANSIDCNLTTFSLSADTCAKTSLLTLYTYNSDKESKPIGELVEISNTKYQYTQGLALQTFCDQGSITIKGAHYDKSTGQFKKDVLTNRVLDWENPKSLIVGSPLKLCSEYYVKQKNGSYKRERPNSAAETTTAPKITSNLDSYIKYINDPLYCSPNEAVGKCDDGAYSLNSMPIEKSKESHETVGVAVNAKKNTGKKTFGSFLYKAEGELLVIDTTVPVEYRGNDLTKGGDPYKSATRQDNYSDEHVVVQLDLLILDTSGKKLLAQKVLGTSGASFYYMMPHTRRTYFKSTPGMSYIIKYDYEIKNYWTNLDKLNPEKFKEVDANNYNLNISDSWSQNITVHPIEVGISDQTFAGSTN